MSFNQIATTAIILNRLNYGEADRIISVLTPDHGKLSLIAKAAKREKSKLAGGIELFCESNISFVLGKGELGTLTSARLLTHYGNIVKDIGRTTAGFLILKIIHKSTEANAGPEWYELSKYSLAGLNELDLEQNITELWFNLHWLKITGRIPNLHSDTNGKKLITQTAYEFDLERMAFYEKPEGSYNPSHIKLLRLVIAANHPSKLAKIKDMSTYLQPCVKLSNAMLAQFVQI